MKRLVFLAAVATPLSGCAVLPDGLFGNRERVPEAVAAAPEPQEGAIPGDARTVEDFDTTTTDDRATALQGAAATGGETDLGVTIASLGDVAQSGIWLKTPLVAQATTGRVEVTETGKAVAVDLLPLEGAPGAGSRISLAAMRLLEVDLTALAEVRVYRSN